jgi:hypothetical protein
MRPRDTSPEAWKFFIDRISQMTPDERLQRAIEHSAAVRAFVESGIRSRHPNATDREVFLIAAKQRLGHDLFRKVYGNELQSE